MRLPLFAILRWLPRRLVPPIGVALLMALHACTSAVNEEREKAGQADRGTESLPDQPGPAAPPRDAGGAQEESPVGEEALEVVTIDRGAFSAISEKRALAIRDAAAYEKLWAEHAGLQVPQPPAPPVDFGTRMVLAYFRGTFPSGGYGAEIRSVERRGDSLHARVALTDPAPDAMTSQAITQPFHVVSVAASEQPVVFDELPAADPVGPRSGN